MADMIGDDDYATLAGFRHELRRFFRFSHEAARGAGLMPQQHEALLSIRAAPARTLSVGGLADHLLLKAHSASELVDRLETLDLVRRTADNADRRRVTVALTPRAEALLASLAAAHRAELRRIRPLLTSLLARL